LAVPGIVESINVPMLNYFYEIDDKLVVFFYEDDDRDADEIIEGLESDVIIKNFKKTDSIFSNAHIIIQELMSNLIKMKSAW